MDNRERIAIQKIKEETDSIRNLIHGGTGIIGLWRGYQQRIEEMDTHLDNIDRLFANL